MRKIGIESAAYFNVCDDTAEGFEKMKSHGFDCVDLNLADTHDVPASIYHKSRAEFERILLDVKKNAENSGIIIQQTHGPWVWPPKNATPEDRAEWKMYTEMCIEANEILDCRNMVLHPVMPFGSESEPDSAEYHRINYEFFKGLAPLAEQKKVKVCIENMPFPAQSLATPKQIMDFVLELEADCFGVCLDTGHSAVMSVPADEAVRTMAKRLCAIHVHDNDGRGDRHDCPFFGVTDWAAFKQAMDECVPEALPIMLETCPGNRGRMPREIADVFLPSFAAAARYLAR